MEDIQKTPLKDLKASRRKGRPREFNRECALRKALLVFWTKGYSPTSVSDLCAAMGINAPSLYSCYGNKGSLFLEAARYYKTNYWQAISARMMAEQDIHKAIRQYFEDGARLLLNPHLPGGCMLTLSAVNMDDGENEIQQAIDKMRQEDRDLFASRLRQAITDGQIPPDTDIPSLSQALYALLIGLSFLAREGAVIQSQLVDVAANAVKLLPASCH